MSKFSRSKPYHERKDREAMGCCVDKFRAANDIAGRVD
jgi:hypothetical protein